MSATGTPTDGATPATSGVRLNFEVIDRRLAEMGVPDDTTKAAEALGLDRVSVWRFRNERVRPLLETAVRIADRIGVKLEQIVERVHTDGASS